MNRPSMPTSTKKKGHKKQIIYEDYIARGYAHFILKYP